eukprot:752843-Hanusia_phi.AAC.9
MSKKLNPYRETYFLHSSALFGTHAESTSNTAKVDPLKDRGTTAPCQPWSHMEGNGQLADRTGRWIQEASCCRARVA